MSKLYTVKETAKILGFSTNTIYKYLDTGRLKGTRGSAQQGRFRIPQSQLDQFLGQPLEPIEKTDASITTSKLTSGALPLLPIKLVRLLLIISLLFIISEVVVNRDFSLKDQAFRLVIIGIFIVLSYQFISFTKGKKEIPSQTPKT
jgi:excisionase family DNA binding protein